MDVRTLLAIFLVAIWIAIVVVVGMRFAQRDRTRAVRRPDQQ